MIVIYGLRNCDSCRKALNLMQETGAAHRFHDLRGDGLPPERLARWLEAVGWETLVNRRSTTWRGLPEAEKVGLDAAGAGRLLARHPTLVKRPVIEAGGAVIVGLGPAELRALKSLLDG